MENNCFFGTILRSLGFTVHSAGARVAVAASGTPAKASLAGTCPAFHLVRVKKLKEAGHRWLTSSLSLMIKIHAGRRFRRQ